MAKTVMVQYINYIIVNLSLLLKTQCELLSDYINLSLLLKTQCELLSDWCQIGFGGVTQK